MSRKNAHAAFLATQTVLKHSIIAVDPGLNNPGIAIFRDGVLVAASRVKPDKSSAGMNMGERCRQVAIGLRDYCYKIVPTTGHDELTLHTLVIEWPQIYVAAKSKGDPNDLPPMVGVSMYLAGMLGLPVRSYTPREWLGGTCPKATTGDPWASVRGQRVWVALSELERLRIVPSHDAIDATGIGLHYLNRFAQVKFYSGSTKS